MKALHTKTIHKKWQSLDQLVESVRCVLAQDRTKR